MGYVPKGADPELDESIRRWRQDWAALRDKFAITRKTSGLGGGERERERERARARGREGGRRVVSLSSSFLAARRGGGMGGDGEEGESNSSASAMTSPTSLR